MKSLVSILICTTMVGSPSIEGFKSLIQKEINYKAEKMSTLDNFKMGRVAIRFSNHKEYMEILEILNDNTELRWIDAEDLLDNDYPEFSRGYIMAGRYMYYGIGVFNSAPLFTKTIDIKKLKNCLNEKTTEFVGNSELI